MSEDTPHRRLLIDCAAHHAFASVPPPWKTASVGGAPRGVVRKVTDAATNVATGVAAGAVNGLAVTINGVARALEAAARLVRSIEVEGP